MRDIIYMHLLRSNQVMPTYHFLCSLQSVGTASDTEIEKIWQKLQRQEEYDARVRPKAAGTKKCSFIDTYSGTKRGRHGGGCLPNVEKYGPRNSSKIL